jgi:very-short-patch-repair endonuclease/predicted transcriptional regulator of viral defense system
MGRKLPPGRVGTRRWAVVGDPKSRERALDALARRQHGVVARRQLLVAGLGRDWIDARLKAERLRRVHRGVYVVGPIAAPRVAEMAAVLAYGEGATVSHRSATSLWRLLPYPAHDGTVDVTVPARYAKHRPGIRVHRVRCLPSGERTKLDGIPITTPARTLLDLAAVAPSRALEQAMAEAERRLLARRSELAALLSRYPGRPGSRVLRVLLEADEGPALTRSEAEERFLSLIRKAGLPAPSVNARLGPYEVDFLWREAGLAVEVDGFAFHADRASFEADRRRDADLASRGVTVVRVTWRQIVDQPEAMLVRIGQALARLGG